MTNLIAHLENFAGRTSHGWSTDADGRPVPFQVAAFEGGPFAGARMLATVGLSHAELDLGETGRRVRQELVMFYRAELGERNLPGVLQQVGLDCLKTRRGLLRGETIGPRGPIVDGFEFVSLYVGLPIYYPDEFAVVPSEVGPIVLAWLVPITADETALVRTRGWEAFEQALAEQDPDLLDMNRRSISCRHLAHDALSVVPSTFVTLRALRS